MPWGSLPCWAPPGWGLTHFHPGLGPRRVSLNMKTETTW
jgi:hypothetical protein